VLVRSARRGAVVLGARGTRHLDEERIEGEDPLAPFGPSAAAHVRRTDGFAHCPDLLVNAAFSPDTEEVAAFEELVGSHGGMGGSQSFPFVLFPSALPYPEGAVVGAEGMHRGPAPLARRAGPRRLPRRCAGHRRWWRRFPTSVAMTVTR
jgi:hypothetical protein